MLTLSVYELRLKKIKEKKPFPVRKKFSVFLHPLLNVNILLDFNFFWGDVDENENVITWTRIFNWT